METHIEVSTGFVSYVGSLSGCYDTNVARKTSVVEMDPEADDDFWSYQSQDLYR